jgi:hypothetical protein
MSNNRHGVESCVEASTPYTALAAAYCAGGETAFTETPRRNTGGKACRLGDERNEQLTAEAADCATPAQPGDGIVPREEPKSEKTEKTRKLLSFLRLNRRDGPTGRLVT